MYIILMKYGAFLIMYGTLNIICNLLTEVLNNIVVDLILYRGSEEKKTPNYVF